MEMLENRMVAEPLQHYLTSDECDELIEILNQKDDERWEDNE